MLLQDRNDVVHNFICIRDARHPAHAQVIALKCDDRLARECQARNEHDVWEQAQAHAMQEEDGHLEEENVRVRA